jgi:hypothetical protein
MRFSIAAALLLLGLAAGCTAPDPDPTGREAGTGQFGAGVHADDTAGR